MEFAEIVIANPSGHWFDELVGRSVLAIVEFSTFNGTKVLFQAKPITLPPHLKKHLGRPIHPQFLILA